MNCFPIDRSAPTLKQQLQGGCDAFAARFGRPPQFAAAAPGRVNLIGEHTDYNGGFVLPMAIDRRAILLAAPAGRDETTIRAEDLEEEIVVNLSRPIVPHPSRWANHLLGVMRGFQQQGAAMRNLEMLLTSNVPIGAGLSSSAAIEVAAATLMEQSLNVRLDPLAKARLCQLVEHEFVGTPCGIMDMLASISGRADHAMLIDCRSNEIRHVPMPPARDMTLLIVDTGVRRELADGRYARRRATCEAAARAMGIGSLREAASGMLDRASLDADQRRCARHVVDENERVLLAAAALRIGDLDALGELMFQSHSSLRDLFEVSCPELDAIVAAALERRGDEVIGARMTGAGFGGCAVIACRSNAADSIARDIRRRFNERFGRTPDVFAVAASDGACAIIP